MASSWDTYSSGNNGEYSVDKFYPEATDGKGHYEEIRCKVPTALMGRIGHLIAEKKLPYRTSGDFLRDAMVHRASYLEKVIEDGELKYEIGFLVRYLELEALNKRQDLEMKMADGWDTAIRKSSNEEKKRLVTGMRLDLGFMRFDEAKSRVEKLIQQVEG